MDYKIIKEYLEKQKVKIVEEYDFEKRIILYSKDLKQKEVIRKIHGDEEIVRAYILAKLVNELGYQIKDI